MAQRTKYEFYDFERFEPKIVTNSAAAPKIDNIPNEKPDLRVIRKPKLTARQLKEQTNKSFRQTAKIFIIAVIALTFFGIALYSRVQLDEINRDISAIDKNMSMAMSDTTKLQNQLNSVVSMDKVENFAYNTLGMVKVQDYQVVYVDLSNEDNVALADGKTVEKSNEEVINGEAQ